MVIKTGSKISVEYTGTFDDGTVFDSSNHEGHTHPLEFEVGSKAVIPGFEQAVLGMKVGEEKEFRATPKEAYGEYNPQLIKEVPNNNLPAEVKPGMLIGIQLPNGAKVPVKVVEISDKTVKLDLNHPLAGKALNFKIKIIEVV